jgi:hypothetical protein
MPKEKTKAQKSNWRIFAVHAAITAGIVALFATRWGLSKPNFERILGLGAALGAVVLGHWLKLPDTDKLKSIGAVLYMGSFAVFETMLVVGTSSSPSVNAFRAAMLSGVWVAIGCALGSLFFWFGKRMESPSAKVAGLKREIISPLVAMAVFVVVNIPLVVNHATSQNRETEFRAYLKNQGSRTDYHPSPTFDGVGFIQGKALIVREELAKTDRAEFVFVPDLENQLRLDSSIRADSPGEVSTLIAYNLRHEFVFILDPASKQMIAETKRPLNQDLVTFINSIPRK